MVVDIHIVSSNEQKIIRQEEKSKEYNIPILNNMMATLKSDDKLVVDSISRFAKNTKDLDCFCGCGGLFTFNNLHIILFLFFNIK